jgi:hypothetical protein
MFVRRDTPDLRNHGGASGGRVPVEKTTSFDSDETVDVQELNGVSVFPVSGLLGQVVDYLKNGFEFLDKGQVSEGEEDGGLLGLSVLLGISSWDMEREFLL